MGQHQVLSWLQFYSAMTGSLACPGYSSTLVWQIPGLSLLQFYADAIQYEYEMIHTIYRLQSEVRTEMAKAESLPAAVLYGIVKASLLPTDYLVTLNSKSFIFKRNRSFSLTN